MAAIHAVFFDIGDTLVYDDPPLRERLRLAMRTVGLSFDESRLPAAFRAGEDCALAQSVRGVGWDEPASLRESAQRIVKALDLPSLSDALWAELSRAFVATPFVRVLHPQTLPLIAELRGRGFRVGAVSDWEQTLPELLTELGLAPHLDALAVSALVGVTKPHPALFQEALRQIGVPPQESLHVGDYYELDVAGARAAGMRPLLFDWKGRVPRADCPRVETFDALAAYLRRLPEPRRSAAGVGFEKETA